MPIDALASSKHDCTTTHDHRVQSWSTDCTSPFRISSSIIPRKLGQSSANRQFQKLGSCASRRWGSGPVIHGDPTKKQPIW